MQRLWTGGLGVSEGRLAQLFQHIPQQSVITLERGLPLHSLELYLHINIHNHESAKLIFFNMGAVRA